MLGASTGARMNTSSERPRPTPADLAKPVTAENIRFPTLELARLADLPYQVPKFTIEYYFAVGAIVLSWSVVDGNFQVLGAWLNDMAGDPAGAELLASNKFDKKVKLAQTLANKLWSAEPEVLSLVEGTLAEVKELAQLRNILVHGHQDFAMFVRDDKTVTHKMQVTGRYNHTKQTLDFDLNRLADLRYRMMHAAGIINEILRGRLPPTVSEDERTRHREKLIAKAPKFPPIRGRSAYEAGVRIETRAVHISKTGEVIRGAPVHPDDLKKLDLKWDEERT